MFGAASLAKARHSPNSCPFSFDMPFLPSWQDDKVISSGV